MENFPSFEDNKENLDTTPEGWTTNGALAKKLGTAWDTIRKIAEQNRNDHPEWFKEYKVGTTKSTVKNRTLEHYSPELTSLIEDTFSKREKMPEGWTTEGALSEDLKVDWATIHKFTSKYKDTNPEWFKNFYSRKGRLELCISPELIKLFKESFLTYISVPEGWITAMSLSKKNNISYHIVKKIVDEEREQNPEMFRVYRGVGGQGPGNQPSEHISPDLIPVIERKILEEKSIEEAPDGWMTVGFIRKKFNTNDRSIQILSDKYRVSNPNWFKSFKDKQNRMFEFYSPELIKIIERKLSEEQPPKGWATAESVSSKFKLAPRTILQFTEQERNKHPEWFETYKSKNFLKEYYSPELISLIQERFDLVAPEGWYRKTILGKRHNLSFLELENIISKYRESHPEWIRQFKIHSGQHAEHYSPELVNLLEIELEKLNGANKEDIPPGWIKVGELASQLNTKVSRVRKITSSYKNSNPEWFKNYKINKRDLEVYSPELVEIVKNTVEGIEFLPDGWMTSKSLAKKLDVDNYLVRRTANVYRESNPQWFKKHQTRSGTFEHYSPELVNLIENSLSNRENIPEGWQTVGSVATELNVAWQTPKTASEKYRVSHPEWFRTYKPNINSESREYLSPELVEKIMSDLSSIENAPTGWMTNGAIAKKLRIANSIVSELANKYRESKPDWFKNYRFQVKRSGVQTKGGSVAEHFSPELFNELKEEILKYGVAPDGWMTNHFLTHKLGSSEKLIRSIAYEYKPEHPEWFKNYKFRFSKSKRHKDPTIGGAVREHYSPELIEKIEKRILEIKEAPEGWITKTALAKVLDIGPELIENSVNKYRETNPEWFKEYKIRVGGGIFEHYSPDLIRLLNENFAEYKKAPDGWKLNRTLAEELGVDKETTQRIANKYKESNQEWFMNFKSQRRLSQFYSPELVRLIKEEFPSLTEAPEGWKTPNDIAKKLNTSDDVIRYIANPYRGNSPEFFGRYKKTTERGSIISTYYSPALIELIENKFVVYEVVPENWVVANTLVKKLSVPKYQIDKVSAEYRESHPEWFKVYRARTKQGQKNLGGISEYYSPELQQAITDKINSIKSERLNIKINSEREQKLTHDFEELTKEVSGGKTANAQQFRKLVSLFGNTQVVDILYKYRPEFKGVSPEYVKGTLAKYLGDFLVVRNTFKIKDLGEAVPYLSERTFKEALFDVIKEAVLNDYHDKKLHNKQANDKQIIADYIQTLRTSTTQINSSELIEVINSAEQYYNSLFNDFEKPSNIVGVLEEGRPFPDLNQAINIKEISDRKKMLIADEMGLGKSASAILSKEYLHSKLALVVVPSNVLNTWEKYLSDEVSENGEQIGYFKKGQTPNVLLAEDPKSLEEAKQSKPDYILISQEKLTERYLEKLKELGYDMLIVDEVHKLKNLEKGKRAQGVIQLAESIQGEEKHLVMLSGTPVPNKIRDVAMTLKLLYPEKFENVEDRDLVNNIINGDLVDIRSLLVPRMQMKELRESIEMPKLTEETIVTRLSTNEQDIYEEALLDDDEIVANTKMRTLRKFLMNPSSLEITPDIGNSKIEDARIHLNKIFETKDKVVMFVNSYIEGMIRGDNSIIEKLRLPPDVDIKIIEGDIPMRDRPGIQKEFQEAGHKVLLVVSGDTADVGVDFSSAEHVFVYNDPWTLYQKKQQIARVYRPGLKNDLTVTTSVVEGTIEQGIKEYIQLKYNAIQKLLKGVPITDIEKNMLRQAEKQKTPDIEGDTKLAKEWLSSPQNRLRQFFAMTKEVGEEKFLKFLLEHGDEYAESYSGMGSRGFQANTGRVSGTLIDSFVVEKKQKTSDLRILDIASGPEMLKTHIGDKYKNQVFSLDINQAYFQNKQESAVMGSFKELPIKEGTIDYANLSLALDITKFIPSKGEYERLAVLSEMNKVLKDGGRAIVNMIYSDRLKDKEKFSKVVEAAGFKIVHKYTGDISSGEQYQSYCIVLEKVGNINKDFNKFIGEIGEENMDGAKLKETDVYLKNGRRIISGFDINGKHIPIVFNENDKEMLEEERVILREGRNLREKYKTIKAIPREEIILGGFIKIFNGKSYRLLKKSEKIGGFVDIR